MLQFIQYPSGAHEFLVVFVLLDLQFYIYVLWIVVCPFELFLLGIVLSVLLRYTDSDCPFGIFKLLIYYIYIIGSETSSNQLCLQLCTTHIVLLFCFSSSCVPKITSFSGLSLFDCPIGILYRLFMLIRLLKNMHTCLANKT